jgi:hypothetical protein
MNFYYRKNFPCATFSFECISYHIPKPHHATQHSLRISIWTIQRIVNRVSAHFHTALPCVHFHYLSPRCTANRVNFSHRYRRSILCKCNSCRVCRGFWMGCSISVFSILNDLCVKVSLVTDRIAFGYNHEYFMKWPGALSSLSIVRHGADEYQKVGMVRRQNVSGSYHGLPTIVT